MPAAAEAKSDSKVETKKRTYPRVKMGRVVLYNPEGDTTSGQVSILQEDVTEGGRAELLVLPAMGGEVIRKRSVIHESDFPQVSNLKLRLNGSWSQLPGN